MVQVTDSGVTNTPAVTRPQSPSRPYVCHTAGAIESHVGRLTTLKFAGLTESKAEAGRRMPPACGRDPCGRPRSRPTRESDLTLGTVGIHSSAAALDPLARPDTSRDTTHRGSAPRDTDQSQRMLPTLRRYMCTTARTHRRVPRDRGPRTTQARRTRWTRQLSPCPLRRGRRPPRSAIGGPQWRARQSGERRKEPHADQHGMFPPPVVRVPIDPNNAMFGDYLSSRSPPNPHGA